LAWLWLGQGNVGRVLADVGAVTLDTLRSFDIPYDELIFGKVGTSLKMMMMMNYTSLLNSLFHFLFVFSHMLMCMWMIWQ